MSFPLSVVFLCVFVIWPTAISAWSGNVCSRLKCTSERVRVCAYSTWRGCCAYKYVWKTKYVRENYCCRGWTDTNNNQVCTKAICNPSCKNGGKCIRPNICDCPFGRDGLTCEGITCSHLKPCFPGNCTARSQCTCQTGFTGKTCSKRQVADEQRSNIWLNRATLSNVARENNMMKWSFVTDSSNPDDSTPDEIWSNQLDYNYLLVEAAAQFDPNVYPPPAYVAKYGFGVVASTVYVNLTKIPRPGEKPDPVLENYPCQETSRENSGTHSFWNCSVKEKDFIWKIESGDVLNITTMFESGGYRNLIDLNTNGARKRAYAVQQYTRLPSTKTLLFKFDKTGPSHCAIDNSCKRKENPLDVTKDITGEKTRITWSGYKDSLSGMFRYSWEVFKLQPVDTQGRLGEVEPLSPLEIHEVMHEDLARSLPIEFKPPSPGMYSFILEASDRANNSIYTRRLVLFDDKSNIEVKSPIQLTTSTNPPNTTEAWQNSLTNYIGIQWENSFINQLHVDNKLLNEVLTYPTQFTGRDPDVGSIDNFKKKFVRLDDHTGDRTIKQIANIGGIINFQFECTINGKTVVQRDSLLKVGQRLDKIKRNDGDAVVVKVIARDVIGHIKESSRRLNFDSTGPNLRVVAKQGSNTTSMSIPFGTRIGLIGEDVESGIHEIRWQLERKNILSDPPVTIQEGTIQRKTCNSRGKNCYCIKTGECFQRQFALDVDHCRFNISKGYLNTASVKVKMEAVNSAGLTEIKEETFSNIRKLHGIGYYSSAVDLKVLRNGHNSVRIGWNKTVSCYYLTEFWLRRSDKPGKEKVHRRSTFTDVGFLKPETNYTVEIIAGYGGEMSDPIFLEFTTEPTPAASGLSAGGKAGVGIAIIILLAAILLIAAYVYTGGALVHVLLGRSNRNEKQIEQVEKRRTLFDGDEDVYIYGIGSGGGVNLPLAHIIDRNSLALQDLIAEGKFAKVYKAGMTTRDDEKKTVAAKMLRDNFTEDEKRLMCAKITFMSDIIGDHANVVNFIGAVVDNEIWGPTMVLEYCEMGTLITWLQGQKDNVNDDLLERLFKFSHGIVDGMEYLSSLCVVHRRLAARNILLTFVMEPKITGFGPSVVDAIDEDQKERVPIRWVAPECFQSTKNATTKSDVWSYGIVLYEIFSLGGQPYPTLKTADVIPKVRHGHKMNRPELADEFNYRLMLKCWNTEEKNRPTFKELVSDYDKFMMGESNDLDYSNYAYKT